MKILVLGHKGMLGRAVSRFFFQSSEYEVSALTTRWGELSFKAAIKNLEPDFIINCIGKIPQKNPVESEYIHLNIELPRFLETLNIPIIHPSTDCEFIGDIPPGRTYTKLSLRDANDVYGITKATISKEIEEKFQNTKIIRTSIIGHEETTSVALLDWFLSQNESVKGYTNHYWNGITTLEWAKQCKELLTNWDDCPTLNQLGTANHYSKFDMLTLAKEVYKREAEILPFTTPITVNKCLKSDKQITELKEQLIELRDFFDKN